MEKVDTVHRYLCIDRWNHLGDIGMRDGTRYAAAAEALLIHVDLLKAADQYVHYTRLKELSERLKAALRDRKDLEPDYYSPIEETAYCGTYTLRLKFVLEGCAADQNLRERSRQLASRLQEELPPEVDGFKVTDVSYACKSLGTKGSIGVGYLWRRGLKLREMKPSDGLYGRQLPEATRHWHQSEWNDAKPLRQISVP